MTMPDDLRKLIYNIFEMRAVLFIIKKAVLIIFKKNFRLKFYSEIFTIILSSYDPVFNHYRLQE